MRFLSRAAVILAAAFLAVPAFGQGNKGSGSTAGSNTPAVPPAGTYNTPNSNLPPGFQPTPQFVSGKVAMDDGTPPPEGIPIERVCGGISHTEGHTDSKGGFGFEMGRDDLVQDSSFSGNATVDPNRPVVSSDIGADPNRPYRMCDIRASLPGYRSEAISLSLYKPGENTSIGTILLHKMGTVAGSVISATSAAAPRNAVKAYNRGLEEVKKNQLPDAVQSFGQAVQGYPEYAAAWLELGKAQVSLRQPADAEKSFQAALQAEPRFLSPYVEFSQLAFQQKNWQEVADITDRLLQLDSFDFPREYYYNGLAHYTLQQMEPAEKSLRETARLDRQNQFPKSHQFLAAILVTKKDYQGALDELRSYLKLAPTASDADNVRHQLDALERTVGSGGRK